MTKDELKNKIMYEFEKVNCKPNHIVMMRTFIFGLFSTLNPNEKELINDAINELIHENKITRDLDGQCLRLTQNGFNGLYQDSASIEQFEEEVMDKFRRGNYRVGQGFMMQSITLTWMQNLNPIERDRLITAINNLIERQFISYDEGAYMLKLEQAGYDNIYQ